MYSFKGRLLCPLAGVSFLWRQRCLNPQSPELRDGEQRLPKRGGVPGDDGEKASLASTHASSPLGTRCNTRRLI